MVILKHVQRNYQLFYIIKVGQASITKDKFQSKKNVDSRN